MSKEHDEDAEYYHDMDGDVFLGAEEAKLDELDDNADDSDKGKRTALNSEDGKWTLVVKSYGRVVK